MRQHKECSESAELRAQLIAYENKIKNELYTECSSIINTVETKILFDFEGRNEKETREKFIDRQIGKDAPEDHEPKNI